jgi:antitoxin ParD1/3/4
MPQASVSLTPQQLELVERLVRSGRFDGATDVVSTGLQLLEERERSASDFIGRIERAIEKGLASGEAAPMEPAQDLLARFRPAR